MTSSSSSSSAAGRRGRGWAEWLLPLAGWAVGAGLFFRTPLTSGFDRLFGDKGDARLIVVLHEHWLAVLRGDRGWRDPGFFHGYEGALGFSDTLFLDSLVYVPLRLLGADPFLSLQLTLVALSAIGFASTFVLLRRYLGLPLPASVVLAGIAAFPNALANAASHPQLFAVHWVPLALLLIVVGLRSTGRRAHLAGAAGGALLGLITFTAFYIGWATLLGIGLTGVAFVALGARQRLRLLRDALAAHRGTIAAIAGGLVLSLAPSLATYLPVLDDIGARSYGEVMYLAPAPGDAVNVGVGSYAWGGVLNRLFADSTNRLGNPEVSLAPTPLLVAAALGAAAVAWSRRRHASPAAPDLVLALVAAGALLVLLPVRWASWSLWVVPWNLVPGAAAIRATGRLAVLVPLVAVLAIGGALRLALPRPGRPGHRRPGSAATLVAVALALVWAEQANRTKAVQLDRSDELAALDAPAEPPSSCEAFYLVDTSGQRRAYHLPAIDAMLLSMETGLPTVNGYSGSTPPGYQLDAFTALDVADPTYEPLIARWVDRHDLEAGLCRYDRATRSWDADPDLPAPNP